MAYITGLKHVYDLVAARFAAESTPAELFFGWREIARQPLGITANPSIGRVVWTPGDRNGAFGDLLPIRKPGRYPRPLGRVGELATITISAAYNAAPENEAEQYLAARQLYDWVLRAIYLAFVGQYDIVRQEWLAPNPERQRGAAIVVVVAFNSLIVDQGTLPTTEMVSALESPGYTGTLQELDVVENVGAPPPADP